MKLKTVAAEAAIVIVGLASNVVNAAEAVANVNVTGTGTPNDPTRLTGSVSGSAQVGPVTVTGTAGATYNPANGQSSPQGGITFTYSKK